MTGCSPDHCPPNVLNAPLNYQGRLKFSGEPITRLQGAQTEHSPEASLLWLWEAAPLC